MAKSIYIAEKPSVANEFAKALKLNTKKYNGYLESEDAIVTWCVGHLVTMSYPEVYDVKLKKWSFSTLPFIPDKFLYEVIPSVKKQFDIVSSLLLRKDVSTIYVCTDSGREGEYIYRLVENMVAQNDDSIYKKDRRRVWIDSQTEEEVLRGIKEAKKLSEYDNLCASAYLRAKEDYLMGINFSRVLSLKYGNALANFLNQKYCVIAVGRVMTCVLGMIVRREREIREFVKTPFYRILSDIKAGDGILTAEWKAIEGSRYFNSIDLYKDNGFKEQAVATKLVEILNENQPVMATLISKENKTEKKQPPLLYNLAELQNQCSKSFKISPDETLQITQELYEKKMVTYPRTDARVLSTAVAKEISKNISGLKGISAIEPFINEILTNGTYKNISKTKYVNDKQITDHYAIIPTGFGINNLKNISPIARQVYSSIVRRFLAIFLPPAEYKKVSLVFDINKEKFFVNTKVLAKEGYLAIWNKKNNIENNNENITSQEEVQTLSFDELNRLKKNDKLLVDNIYIKEGETSPPKRYNSGSLILSMENAGQLIEDEELRAQIKGSGIGTSATRAEILKKLQKNKYIKLNNKTQIISPDLMGELIYDIVNSSITSLLNPELTASWEKGLTYVSEGTIKEDEYMIKLDAFVTRRVKGVTALNNQDVLDKNFNKIRSYYK